MEVDAVQSLLGQALLGILRGMKERSKATPPAYRPEIEAHVEASHAISIFDDREADAGSRSV